MGGDRNLMSKPANGRAGLPPDEASVRRELEQTAARLIALQRIMAALSEPLPLPDLARTMVKLVGAALGARGGMLVRPTEDGRSLELLASHGVRSATRARWLDRHSDGLGPLADCVRAGEPVIVRMSDPREAADSPASIDRGDGAAGPWVWQPVRHNDRLLGVLGLMFHRNRTPDDADRGFLAVVSRSCGQALERSRLFEAERSAREQAEAMQERLEFLAEATRLLASSLDYELTVSQLAHLCVPRLADWVSIDLVEPGGEVRQLVVAHPDPERIRFATELRQRYPLDLDSPSATAQAIRTGRSHLYPDMTDLVQAQGAQNDQQFQIARSFGLSSLMVVPLSVRDQILGAMTLAYAESGRRYREQDLPLADSLAHGAAIAIDNARVYGDRDRMARTLQRGLLPGALPRIPGVELAARYEPFGEGHDVGGDLYDAFPVEEDTWGLVIGDVCGKGPEAASMMGLVRHSIRATALGVRKPSALLHAVNRAVLEQTRAERFCTVCYVRVRRHQDRTRLTVCLAGHPAPLLVRSDGSVEEVGEPGSLLGLFPDVRLRDVVVDLAQGDALIMFTDGIESRDPPTNSLAHLLAEGVGHDGVASASSIADAVLASVMKTHRNLEDDVAIMVLRVIGSEDGQPVHESMDLAASSPPAPAALAGVAP